MQEHGLFGLDNTSRSSRTQRHIPSHWTVHFVCRPGPQVLHISRPLPEAAQDTGPARQRLLLLGLCLHRADCDWRCHLCHQCDRTDRRLLGHTLLPHPLRHSHTRHISSPCGSVHLHHSGHTADSDHPQGSPVEHACPANQSTQLDLELQPLAVRPEHLLSAVHHALRVPQML